MEWVLDRTGRFQRRPHWLPKELDAECESLVVDFLRDRHGKVTYPVATDDLTVLIESLVGSLDLYADLSKEGADVEGVTDFVAGRRPKVRISERLTNDPRMANRFRTTLTHELGHVKLHTFLFDAAQTTGSLFPVAKALSNQCKRDTILGARQADWMEWQAGYACGALLMPASALRETVRACVSARGMSVASFAIATREGQELIDAVAAAFEVSRDAARVRLEQRGTLAPVVAGSLFD